VVVEARRAAGGQKSQGEGSLRLMWGAHQSSCRGPVPRAPGGRVHAHALALAGPSPSSGPTRPALTPSPNRRDARAGAVCPC
jgi:hypothetical protein